jgi:signal transduction histidine kinase
MKIRGVLSAVVLLLISSFSSYALATKCKCKQAEDELRRSFDQLRALAARLHSVREEERARVAREIHDELGQALTSIKLEAASLIRELPGDAKQQSNRAESIVKLADETIRAVQRIATELRPGILDDLGLVAAVEWAVEEFQARTGTKCHVSLPDSDIDMDPERATALFRILQETLTNVARHANATEVDVRLAKEDGTLTLEIHDNGKGIGEEQLSVGRSLGILGMRERALLLGGELIISGAPGCGTTVRVRIPEAHHNKEPEQFK